MIRLLFTLVLTLLATTAFAQEASDTATGDEAPTEATEKMHESLDRAKPTEDGAKQVPEGKAQPEENWFGCKADEKEQDKACREQGDSGAGQEDASS